MTAGPISPYLAPNFYTDALSNGRHRDIVGGRWDETGRAQMAALRAEGLAPHHRLLEIGAGSLRLGCKAVPYLDPGHYWATDLSGPLMQRGYGLELALKDRLPPAQLVEDADFTYPGIPANIDYAIAFAVFTHLPADHLHRALTNLAAQFPTLHRLLFTVFLAPDATQATTQYTLSLHDALPICRYWPECRESRNRHLRPIGLAAGGLFRAVQEIGRAHV